MPNAEIQVFENLDELSRGAAGRFREAALRATSEGQLFSEGFLCMDSDLDFL